MQPNSPRSDVSDLSADLESSLARALERHLKGPGGAEPPTPPNLAESIRYSLLAPGKRIRPRLALACARLIGLDRETALPAALAIEMIHCFTLIHDDLPCMDDDDFRRGRPSNHKAHGEAIALLAGDALMMLALDTLSEAADTAKPQAFGRALRRFSWASGPRGVIGGQAAEALLGPGSPISDLERMHAMKTGALFSAALLLPMDLAGILESEPRGKAIALFASALGLAFQIADDLDDAEPSEATSILFYQSAAEARDAASRKLSFATQALREAWGESASTELAGIASEVLGSLSAPSKGLS
jgi:geranylgeranyl diphosphate synthase type II